MDDNFGDGITRWETDLVKQNLTPSRPHIDRQVQELRGRKEISVFRDVRADAYLERLRKREEGRMEWVGKGGLAGGPGGGRGAGSKRGQQGWGW